MYSSLIGHSSDFDAFQAEVDAWDVPEFEYTARTFQLPYP